MNGILGMGGVKVVTGAAAAVLLMAYIGPTPALADTIEAALVRAYQTNPQLNSQRASVRATDENVPQALSGYRPRVALTASAGYQYTDVNTTTGGTPTQIARTEIHGTNPPRSAGLTVTQTLFNGQQTANKTRAAESQVSGAREALRVLEQSVLLSAAGATATVTFPNSSWARISFALAASTGSLSVAVTRAASFAARAAVYPVAQPATKTLSVSLIPAACSIFAVTAGLIRKRFAEAPSLTSRSRSR